MLPLVISPLLLTSPPVNSSREYGGGPVYCSGWFMMGRHDLEGNRWGCWARL